LWTLAELGLVGAVHDEVVGNGRGHALVRANITVEPSTVMSPMSRFAALAPRLRPELEVDHEPVGGQLSGRNLKFFGG
jgi:hypothetical protein